MIRKRESKKAKNGYVYEVIIKYKDFSGNQKRISKSGFVRKIDAERYADETLSKIKENMHLKTEKHTFDDIFQLYIINDPFTKESTKYVRNSVYNKHLKDTMGKCDISKIDYEYIQNTLNEFAKNNTKQTIENIYKIINGVFTFAYNNNYISRKPYVKLKLNGIKTQSKKKTITLEEFNMLIDRYKHPRKDKILENDNYIVALYIGLYTGIRISECLGLKREDVDLQKNIISINKQIQRVGTEIKETTLKSDASYRSLPVSNELQDILEKHFKKYPESEYVVFDKDMNYMKSEKLRKSLARSCEKLGITFNYHMLRHMFITQLYNKGVDIKVAQSLAGHSSYQTTADIYTELDQEKTVNFNTSNLYN